MKLEDIENGTFQVEEYTFNKGQMNFIVSAMFNYFTDFYEEYGVEEGEDLFQDFCQQVQDKFDETERDDINSVLKLVETLIKEKGANNDT